MEFQKGQLVKFKESALSGMNAASRKRLSGRVGVIGGYRFGARDPFVIFPRSGRLKEIKLFEVTRDYLEAAPVRSSEVE